MKICLVKAGEPLPTDNDHSRLLRTGILFEYLARDNEVRWITEAFNHQHKTRRFETDTTVEVSANAQIRLLSTLGYRGNISAGRMLDDLHFAWKVWRDLRSNPNPDVIVCAYPLVLTAFACVLHAKQRKIPIVVDVRDLWPDIFSLATRRVRKILGTALALVLEPFARYTFRNATSVIGITDAIVDWACKKAKRVRQTKDVPFALGFLPQPVDPANKTKAIEFWNDLGIKQTDFIFAYVGQINNKVDVETVVRGFIAADLPPSARLVIAGAGDEIEKIRPLCKGVPGIIFPGWINKFQLEVLLQMASVGLAPYRNRLDFQLSIPNKVIEYLYYSVPVAASIDGEIKRLIQTHDCGVAYEEGKPDSFAAVATQLFHDTQGRKGLSQNARLTYNRFFDGNTVFSALTAHLQSFHVA
jgi:glycosyltransferase involved in cell wall biosynthesis